MSASVAPSPGRLTAARRAGLRPRSRLGVTALVAAGLACAGYGGAKLAPMILHAALVGALRGELPGGLSGGPSAVSAGVGLTLLFSGLAGCLTLARARARVSSAEPGLEPGLDEIATPLRWALCGLALVLVIAALRAGLAGAARAVDAPLEPETLVVLWSTWLWRALIALACLCGVLGVIERLASARRLWQGLHLTPAQARERARALGHRRT